MIMHNTLVSASEKFQSYGNLLIYGANSRQSGRSRWSPLRPELAETGTRQPHNSRTSGAKTPEVFPAESYHLYCKVTDFIVKLPTLFVCHNSLYVLTPHLILLLSPNRFAPG